MKKQLIYKYGLIFSVITLITLLISLLFFIKQNQISDSASYFNSFSIIITLAILLIFFVFYIAWKSQLELISFQAESKDLSDKKNINKQDFNSNSNETIDYYKIIEEIIEKSKSDSKDEIVSKFIREVSLNLNMGAAIAFKKTSKKFTPIAQWAILIDKKDIEFTEGEGIHGQAAQNKKIIRLSEISDSIIIITSSSGKTSPKSLYIIPMLIENKTEFLIEFASFKSDDEDEFEAIKVLAEKLQSLIEKAK